MKKKNLQQEVEEYLVERNWKNLEAGDLAKSICLEAAELLENWQWKNFTNNEIKKDKEKFQNVKDELGDVLTYAIDMAIILGLDFENIVREKLAKVKAKYPKEEMQKNGGDTDDIKKKFRKNKK
jgi:NTP pyrophosphatase (non-canonical NTP hydrolase)